MTTQIVTVRAIPAPGWDRRVRAGISWTKAPQKCRVVDKPAAFNPATDEVREIDAATLDALMGDPMIAVQAVGDGAATSLETNALKVQIAKLEGELADVKRELAAYKEESAAVQAASIAQAEEHGRQLAAVQGELQNARAQLESRKKRDKE